MSYYLGKKLGMTQLYDEAGKVVPVTLVGLEENRVLGVRTPEKEGYAALQVGVGEAKKEKRKFKLNMWKGASGEALAPARLVREIPLSAAALSKAPKPGEVLPFPEEAFAPGSFVDVQGVSSGKGFQGVVKRHGMSGGRKTHGSHFHRAPGSIGNCSYPARVHKGKKMAGRMGNERVTLQNLEVVKVLLEDKILLLKGSVPGKKGGELWLKSSVKKSSVVKQAAA